MKAAVFSEPGVPLTIETVPDPEPGPGDLILKVHACGICGTDLHWSDNADPTVGWRHLERGAVMGHEFSGEVVAVDKDSCGTWKVGDRVTAQPFSGCGHCPTCLAGRAYRCQSVTNRASLAQPGAYAEYTRVGANASFRLPEAASFDDGALVEPLAVGLNAVERARLQAGDTVLIVGAGPVGLAVSIWCRFFGARHIIISDLVAARAEQATRFGATAAINASREDVRSTVEAISGTQPRVIFDCVGVPGSLQTVIDQAPFDAHIVVVGLCMASDTFFPTKALTKELSLDFAFVYRYEHFAMVLDMIGAGRIDTTSLVTSHTNLAHFPEAFQALKTPSQDIKVMLSPDAV
jgi:(R,R)-butanediol dehydrogenase/meso-butanediol dehydrogenase/diacetyl reductase